jgi:hypothetical protein
MELIMAFVMGAFSVYQAIKSADNLLHCDNRALVQGNESVVPVHR